MIADGFTAPMCAARVMRAVEAGVRWVHLRDHTASPVIFERAVRDLASRLRACADAVCISINTRLSLAQAHGMGLHLGVRGPSVAKARYVLGSERLVGYSAHRAEEGCRVVNEGADYLFYSPVFPTPSKPDHPGVGEAALRAFCRAVPGVPVFALGGVTPDRVAVCLDAGAYGIAVVSGILGASDPVEAVRAYQAALATAAPVHPSTG